MPPCCTWLLALPDRPRRARSRDACSRSSSDRCTGDSTMPAAAGLASGVIRPLPLLLPLLPLALAAPPAAAAATAAAADEAPPEPRREPVRELSAEGARSRFPSAEWPRDAAVPAPTPAADAGAAGGRDDGGREGNAAGCVAAKLCCCCCCCDCREADAERERGCEPEPDRDRGADEAADAAAPDPATRPRAAAAAAVPAAGVLLELGDGDGALPAPLPLATPLLLLSLLCPPLLAALDGGRPPVGAAAGGGRGSVARYGDARPEPGRELSRDTGLAAAPRAADVVSVRACEPLAADPDAAVVDGPTAASAGNAGAGATAGCGSRRRMKTAAAAAAEIVDPPAVEPEPLELPEPGVEAAAPPRSTVEAAGVTADAGTGWAPPALRRLASSRATDLNEADAGLTDSPATGRGRRGRPTGDEDDSPASEAPPAGPRVRELPPKPARPVTMNDSSARRAAASRDSAACWRSGAVGTRTPAWPGDGSAGPAP